MPEVLPINSFSEYQSAINADDDSVAIIDFWATWCGPCRLISPIFEACAGQDSSGKIRYYKVDVDALTDVAAHASISAMPTFVVYKKGSPLDSLKGADRAGLENLIQKFK